MANGLKVRACNTAFRTARWTKKPDPMAAKGKAFYGPVFRACATT